MSRPTLTAGPQNSPHCLSLGCNEVLEALNDSCKWSDVGSSLTDSVPFNRLPSHPHQSFLVCKVRITIPRKGTGRCQAEVKERDGQEWYPPLVLSFQVTSPVVTSFERGSVLGSLTEVWRDVQGKNTNLHIHIAQQGSHEIIPFPDTWRMFKITYDSKTGRNRSIARSCNFCVKKNKI